MALVSPTVEIELDGVWTDITTYVANVRSGITITRGRKDEQPTLEASVAQFSLRNTDGRFSPRNPEGPYYGAIGRNTPIRISCWGAYRFHGEVSAWPTTWDLSGNIAWTNIQAAGIIRRLSQGIPPLQGPIRRYVTADSSPTPVGYWPMDDVAGSTSLASGLSGGSAMALEGTSLPEPGSNSDFPTTDPIVVLNNGATRAQIAANAGTAFYAAFLLSVPVPDTNDTTLFRIQPSGGTVDRFELRYFTASSGGLVVRAFAVGGASILTSATVGAGLDGVPAVVEFEAVQTGGNIAWVCTVTDFDTGSISFVSGTIIGQTLGAPSIVQFNADRAAANIAVGQLVVYITDPGSLYEEYSGFSGETAGRRIERLCSEEGVPFTSVGDLDATEPMGPQIAGTFLGILAGCQDVDLGYLYEPKTALGLEYRTRESLYDQATQVTLTYSNLIGLEPVEDDQIVRNDVTVTRVGGSSARYELTSGPLSVNAPPDGVGRYREDVPALSFEDDTQLAHQAEWRVALGTVDEPRYPDLTVDINKFTAGTKTDMIAVDIGDKIIVTDMPVWVPPDRIDVQVLGYTETIYPTHWHAVYNAIPGAPYATAFVLNDTVNGRLDAASSTTNEALDTTETGVDYTGSAWITTASHPSEFPFDVSIGGETMRVTSATASTLTVTRSINGVVKTHPLGTPIHLAQRNNIVL